MGSENESRGVIIVKPEVFAGVLEAVGPGEGHYILHSTIFYFLFLLPFFKK